MPVVIAKLGKKFIVPIAVMALILHAIHRKMIYYKIYEQKHDLSASRDTS